MRLPAPQPLALRLRRRGTGGDGGDGGGAPPASAPASGAATTDAAPRPPRIWPLVLACLAVAGLTMLAPSSPTYDPWAWILWGREIVQGDLLTTGGPSWKPLPMLFTIPFAALFPDDWAPLLWVWIARAGGLFAVVMVGRLAYRLIGRGVAGVVAGLCASLFLLSIAKIVRDAALSNSEAMLGGLMLLAFERHLDGRRDHALYLATAGALLRPEVWPFLGLYGLWLFFVSPTAQMGLSRLRMRLALVGSAVLILVLWFVPELIGSGDLLRASSRANDPNPGSAAFAENPGLEVVSSWVGTIINPLKLAAVIGGAWALGAFQRRRLHAGTAALMVTGGAWLALVAVMTEGGYAGNPRYLIISTVVTCTIGGIGMGAIFLGLQRAGEWLAAHSRGRLGAHRTGLVTAGAVFALGALMITLPLPIVRNKLTEARENGDLITYEATIWNSLRDVIDDNGGAETLRSCGYVTSGPFQTQMVAYELGLHGFDVGWTTTPVPGVAFQTRTGPEGPLVVEPDDTRYRLVAANDRWRIMTVPPAGDARGSCPTAGPTAPTVPGNPPRPSSRLDG
jgi:hypothetical protein